MKVMLMIEGGHEPVFSEVVQTLESKGCQVDVIKTVVPSWKVNPTITKLDDWVERNSGPGGSFAPSFIERCKAYDLIILVNHCNTEPDMKHLRTHVRPRLGYIVMDHDIFGGGTAHGARDQSRGVVTFQKKQHAIVQRKGFKAIMARWYKLDCHYPEHDLSEYDREKDGVLVGMTLPTMGHARPFEYPDLFRTLWYKPWCPYDKQEKYGSARLPTFFEWLLGSKYCAEIAKFHLTLGGSTYLDSLLFGCIPIIYRAKVNGKWPFPETRVDDIVSRGVGIEGLRAGAGLCVTCVDLPRKIEALRNSPDLFDRTLQRLKEEWFPSNYLSLPTTGQAVWSLIEDA